MSSSNSHNYSRAYFESFILTTTIVWLPSKLFAYLAPFIALLWFIFRSKSTKILLRSTLLLILYALLITIYKLFYYSKDEDFIIQNSLLFLLTYGSFFFLFAIPSKISLYSDNHEKYLQAIKYIILIESILGITQVIAFSLLNGVSFDFATGDVAQGTLSPLSFLHPESNFNNQMFCNNMLMLLLFYLPHAISKKKDLWVCFLGIVATLLASVLHLFLCFFIALIFISFFFSRSFIKLSATKLVLILSVVIIIISSIILQPHNFNLISFYFDKFSNNQSPKTIVTVNSVKKLPKDFPWVYTIGLGPGQYSSRAGLIGTGHYFGDFKKPKEIPLIVNSQSAAFKKYTFSQWRDYTSPKYGSSTMSRPFYSVLSILIELGYVAFAFLLIYLIRQISFFKRRYKMLYTKNNYLSSFYTISCGVTIIYYILISFFENYMEVTQAIFPGLLLYRYFRDYTFYIENKKE
ncbi:MAG: hypothetical protein AB7O73_03425 [Bacteroidia bacterium]